VSLKKDVLDTAIAELTLAGEKVLIIDTVSEPDRRFAFPLSKIPIEALPGEVEESPSD